MWLIGVVLLIAATLAATYALTLLPSRKQPVVPWDLAQVSHRFIFIVGNLSGFTVASAFFIAGFFERSGSRALDTVIGMLLIAFMNLLGTAMIFGTVPTTPPKDDDGARWQATAYILGDAGYYLGVALAWLALLPFLKAIGADFPASIFVWLLLFAVAGGACRLSQKLYVLTAHNGIACLGLPAVGIGAAALYRFVLVPAFPALWPASHSSLLIAATAFGIAAVGFLADTLILALGPKHAISRALGRAKAPYAPLYCQAIVTDASLLWVSVVAP